MPSPSRVDAAGRTIAGLLGYNPGPGIYSRLERAVEAMPANVRVEELPGLLKRYKEGVPGWELREADFPGLIGDAKVIPRQDLLDRVRQQSPVYTHKEIVLGGRPPMGSPLFDVPQWQERPSRIGEGTGHGETVYENYGQGGRDYTELLLIQPDNTGLGYGNHWAGRGNKSQDGAVAHARFDTHGDALRINELQSDLGIYNRKAREGGDGPVDQLPADDQTDEAFRVGRPAGPRPFPLEDAWADLLIKRLMLEAASGGHRAIEVASPRAIADKVGGNIENYEHFYGKVVPGVIERLGRKMGGLTTDATPTAGAPAYDVWKESEDLLNEYRRFHGGDPRIIDAFNDILDAGDQPALRRDAAQAMYALFDDGDPGYATARAREALALADQTNAARAVRQRLQSSGVGPPRVRTPDPGRRYIMSDEMRKRILTQGIGASLLAPMAGAAMEE